MFFVFILIFIGIYHIIDSTSEAESILDSNKPTCYRGHWESTNWIPEVGCEFLDIGVEKMKQCLSNRHVVVAGNSISRHFFIRIYTLLHGQSDNVTYAYRQNEKKLLDDCADVHELTKSDCKETKLGHMCQYAANYLDRICNKEWKINEFSGKLTFIWLWDWHVPILDQYLSEPNTIVTSNAGLNRAMIDTNKFTNDEDNPVLQAKIQFPRLWQAPIANSSYLIYRATTRHDTSYELGKKMQGVIDQQNTWILDYVKKNPKYHHSLLEVDIPTLHMEHYMDTAHHPGPQTELHIQWFLNKVC